MKLLAKFGLLLLMVALLGAAIYLPQYFHLVPDRSQAEVSQTEVSLPVPLSPASLDPANTLEVMESASRPAEISVDAFYAALEAGHLSEARAFLTEKENRLSPHLRESLERGLALAERQEADRKSAQKLRQSVAQLEQKEAEAAKLKEELRILREAEEKPPEAPPPPVPAPVQLTFDFDSSRLDPAQESHLAQAAQFLKERAELRAEVRGYADRQGNPAYNATLSTARSVSVKDALTARGIVPERIAILPFGDTQTDASANAAEQAKFRRVEIRFYLTPP